MIHEQVLQTIRQIAEDTRVAKTPEHLRDDVIRALRLAKRINRLHGDKVPVIHMFDNAISGGMTLEEILRKRMDPPHPNREISVSVGTPPWHGDYLLVGKAKLTSYYPSDIDSQKDERGRLIPSIKPTRKTEFWDEASARQGDIEWTHVIMPPQDVQGARLVKELGLEVMRAGDLKNVFKPAGKAVPGHIQPHSTQDHIATSLITFFQTRIKELETEKEAEDIDSEELEEIDAEVTRYRKAVMAVTNAREAGLVDFGFAERILDTLGHAIGRSGVIA